MSMTVGVILAPNTEMSNRSGAILMPEIQALARFSYSWMTHGLLIVGCVGGERVVVCARKK